MVALRAASKPSPTAAARGGFGVGSGGFHGLVDLDEHRFGRDERTGWERGLGRDERTGWERRLRRAGARVGAPAQEAVDKVESGQGGAGGGAGHGGSAGSGGFAGRDGGGGSAGSTGADAGDAGTVDPRCPKRAPASGSTCNANALTCSYNYYNGCLCTPLGLYNCPQVDLTCPADYREHSLRGLVPA